MNKNEVMNVLKNKKYQWIAILVLLIVIISWSSSIRLSNWDLLTDGTSGEKIPLALDPFYFLRLSEIILEEGGLPEFDDMRYSTADIIFNPEILPYANVFLYKTASIFSPDTTLREVNVASPVIYFIIGLILFFFLGYILTNSKSIAAISSIFLAFVPSYLYRTMAGFSDHEAIGMVGFFGALLLGAFSFKYLESKNLQFPKIKILALATAFLCAFTITAWPGIATALFAIIPLAFMILWFMKIKERKDRREGLKFISYYATWIISSMIFGLLLGVPFGGLIGRFLLSSSGIIGPFVLGLTVLDLLLLYTLKKKEYLRKHLLYALIGTGILGTFGLFLMGENPLSLIARIWAVLLVPFGSGRTGLTIAENAQPYLVDWINQTGKVLFWLFVFGSYFLGIALTKSVKNIKNKVIILALWILMISGILFSRISSSSILNGTNFLSQALYIIGVFLFLGYAVKLYLKKELKIEPLAIFTMSWLLFMIVSGRAAIRMFFAITPFVCFAAAYFIVRTFEYGKENKELILKIVLIGISIISILFALMTTNNFVEGITNQAKATGPSAHYQWQGAMSWVRENTPEDSLFIHWWDYGYWVQYLGERPTVTDGGHAVGYWDHLIGRYLLTTPHPETALSLMKTHGVDYLLIDPTDLGKYSAYSSIGDGLNEKDRYSAIPVMALDPKQTVETSNSTLLIYSGGMFVDEDIVYELNGQQIFLPAEKAAVLGVILEIKADGLIGQLTGVYQYNGQQFRLPIRYAYINGQFLDSGNGIEATIRVMPSFDNSRINPLGAAIYLSPKVSKGLFAKLYLMNDPLNEYPTIKLAHAEQDIVVGSLRGQGAAVEDLIYYGGFRGPIKIWKVDYPSETLIREEFLEISGEYGELDNLEFTE